MSITITNPNMLNAANSAMDATEQAMQRDAFYAEMDRLNAAIANTVESINDQLSANEYRECEGDGDVIGGLNRYWDIDLPNHTVTVFWDTQEGECPEEIEGTFKGEHTSCDWIGTLKQGPDGSGDVVYLIEQN